MRLLCKFMIVIILIMARTHSLAQEDPMLRNYVIGPGDMINISVWKNEPLTRTVTVLPDGRIAFPLIGEVLAAGKSLAQLDRELKKKLSRYIPDLTLSVIVEEVNSLYVYVIGRVKIPGRYVLNGNVNVLQALAMAGGLNEFAKERNVLIFRESIKETKIYRFDYKAVTQGERISQNIRLERGDVVVAR